MLIFQGRSIVTGVWRVNTVTVTTASVNTDMVRTARDTRAAKDIDTFIRDKRFPTMWPI